MCATGSGHTSIDPKLLDRTPGLTPVRGELHGNLPRDFVLARNYLPLVDADDHSQFPELLAGELCCLRNGSDNLLTVAAGLKDRVIYDYRQV